MAVAILSIPKMAAQLAEAVAAGAVVDPGMRVVSMLEDPSDNGVSQATIYSRLELENDSHPFFKHVWTLRHRIDADSPLLDSRGLEILQSHLRDQRAAASASAGGDRKAAAAAAEGSWPPSLNSWMALRTHLQFKEIVVTLSGTDHITGRSVYGHTTYTPADMAIGWRFANPLRKELDGSLGVDLGLISDVLQQVGGGGEPLEVPDHDDDDDGDDDVSSMFLIRSPPAGRQGAGIDVENQKISTTMADHKDENTRLNLGSTKED
jgi:hypothetical protein